MSFRNVVACKFACLLLFTACGNGSDSKSFRQLPSKLNGLATISDYQIGTEWSKKAITSDTLSHESDVFQRAAKATARVRIGFGGATAFVIGEKNGKVIFATNHHVIEDQQSCPGARISFEMLGVSGLKCEKVLVTNTDLDLTIFTVSGLTAEGKQKVLSVARTFSAEAPVKGMELLTIGYGVAGNDGQRNLMGTMDNDCKTFSPDGEMRFMADPDELNPGPYKTWMFATGCDVSHGDSGSAIVDRNTGDVVGILSTGKIPKNPDVRKAQFLSDMYDNSTDAVWKELTFAVPASKIVEIVSSVLP